MRSTKIFCIGLNKTGTSSLELVLESMGYRLGDQSAAEAKFGRWVKRDFRWLAEFCKTADAFQDAPFSFPFTFVYLDQLFPKSKFILTERESADRWYESVVRFHQLIASLEPGIHYQFPYVVSRLFGTDQSDPYEREMAIAYYEQHNAVVKSYFRYRPHDLLVLNVGSKGSLRVLEAFLGRKSTYDEFPKIRPFVMATPSDTSDT